jgi:predicted transcriptional regulator
LEMAPDDGETGTRRALGELELAVLRAAWRSPIGVTPSEAVAELQGSLAYNTALTVLTRLWQKNLLARKREGRAHRYTAVVVEADWIASKMRAALDAASDHNLAISRFVGSLTSDETEALRALLAERPDR